MPDNTLSLLDSDDGTIIFEGIADHMVDEYAVESFDDDDPDGRADLVDDVVDDDVADVRSAHTIIKVQ